MTHGGDPAFPVRSFSQTEEMRLPPSFLTSILKDHRVNNVAADDTSPAEKFLAIAVEFFVGHYTATFLTSHTVAPSKKIKLV